MFFLVGLVENSCQEQATVPRNQIGTNFLATKGKNDFSIKLKLKLIINIAEFFACKFLHFLFTTSMSYLISKLRDNH